MVRLNADTGEVEDALCVVTVDGIYMTHEARYLTQTLYETGTEETLIHQFYISSGAEYAGSARVEGGLFLYGNRDYRINARDGYLRTVTTNWRDDDDSLDPQHVLSLQRTNRSSNWLPNSRTRGPMNWASLTKTYMLIHWQSLPGHV